MNHTEIEIGSYIIYMNIFLYLLNLWITFCLLGLSGTCSLFIISTHNYNIRVQILQPVNYYEAIQR